VANKKILLVDDEENVLAGYKRQLRRHYDFETAPGGKEGLEMARKHGPFAVAISDMRMPGMDGIEFLTELRAISPETVRMMLTGNADLQTCINAVNEGSIFLFLSKPCSNEQLAQAIDKGLDQYRLVTAERELLHGTLRGCIRTLTDVLGLVNPEAFSRGTRIRPFVRHIAAELEAGNFWEFELAATLSQIGCVALPPETLASINIGRPLKESEQRMVANHPNIGCQLLAEVPRLERIAQIIARQNASSSRKIMPSPGMGEEDVIEFGAQLLDVSLFIDRALGKGNTFVQALAMAQEKFGVDHPMVEAMMSYERQQPDRVKTRVRARDLSTSMIAAEDIMNEAGRVVVTRGQRISEPVRLHLQSCAQAAGLQEPFQVEVLSVEG
jgi:response regulator RpfG family c-di-GMP phosphodiesterase